MWGVSQIWEMCRGVGQNCATWGFSQNWEKCRSSPVTQRYGQPLVGTELNGVTESLGPNWFLNITRLRPLGLRRDGYKMAENLPYPFEIQYPIPCSLVGTGGG